MAGGRGRLARRGVGPYCLCRSCLAFLLPSRCPLPGVAVVVALLVLYLFVCLWNVEVRVEDVLKGKENGLCVCYLKT